MMPKEGMQITNSLKVTQGWQQQSYHQMSTIIKEGFGLKNVKLAYFIIYSR